MNGADATRSHLCITRMSVRVFLEILQQSIQSIPCRIFAMCRGDAVSASAVARTGEKSGKKSSAVATRLSRNYRREEYASASR